MRQLRLVSHADMFRACLPDLKYQAAFASRAGTCGMNFRTVSMPGFAVSPARTFHKVVKGTPDSFESSCICA